MAGVAYYAMGGGLGHLVRARAVLHTLGMEAQSHLLSASTYARDARVCGSAVAEIPPPEARERPEALADWVERVLHEIAPDTLFLDVFPAGLLGEITRPLWPAGTRLIYVGRLLRWPIYRARLRAALPRFDAAFFLEPLHADHEAAMRATCSEVAVLDLVDPPSEPPQPLPEGTWVVLHSGPPEETRELVAYARDIRRSEGAQAEIHVVGPREGEAADQVAMQFPASGYFAQAERVITACGFNVMRQARSARAGHHFMPFERPLDDQFARAARRRSGQLHR
jgi:predicted glycosyltransferase